MFSLKENVAFRAVEVVAIRGAVQVEADTPKKIAEGSLLVFNKILEENKLLQTDLISLFFTITPDLESELPPLALYEAGVDIPALCASEHKTLHMIPRVIRIMVHANWKIENRRPINIYLPGTTQSRPK